MRAVTLHLSVCAVAALTPILVPLVSRPAPSTALSATSLTNFPGWPASFEGRPLTRLPATEQDARFLADVSGHVARFSDGEREILIRWSATPSRHLHPSSTCLRAIGWETSPQPLTITARGDAWSTYVATRGVERIEVRERVVDANGRSWSEPTAWYWASLLGETSGPAWAYTVSRRID